MKKIIWLFVLFLVTNVLGQDVNRVINTTFYRDTLTATKDTVQLKFPAGFDYFTISTYSSGSDTILVYTKGEGNYGIWAQKALVDLSSSVIATQIISTTTPKEYLIQVPSTMWLLIITTDVTADAVFTVNAYKGQYAISGTIPSTLPLPSGAATSANQTNGSQRTLVVDGSNAIIGVQTSPIFTKPDDYYYTTLDSVKGADTASYNFQNKYWVSYLTIANKNGSTPDTLVVEHYSLAKGGWTIQAIGLRDMLTLYPEIDNEKIIIPASTAKTFELTMKRIGQVRVRPKNLAGRTTARNSYVLFKGVN